MRVNFFFFPPCATPVDHYQSVSGEPEFRSKGLGKGGTGGRRAEVVGVADYFSACRQKWIDT